MLDKQNESGRRSEHASPRLRSDVRDRYISVRTRRSLSRFGSFASGSGSLQILYCDANVQFDSLSRTPPEIVSLRGLGPRSGERGERVLVLVLSPAVLVHFKFFIATQTFSLIRFHGRLLKLSRFGALALSIGSNAKVGPTHTESTIRPSRISNPRPRWRPRRSARSITSATRNIQSDLKC